MNLKQILMCLAVASGLILGTPAFTADKHTHDTKPLHGGIVVESRDLEYELVAKPDVLQLYVRDHGKPVDIGKATAKVTLLAGTEKQEVTLQPAGQQLEAKGLFKTAAGTKVVVQLTLAGKMSSTRFVLK